jgi:hypothetical protein
MDRQLVAMGKRIPLVMVRGTEAQLLVVGNRARYIRYDEDRLDADDATHTEIIESRLTSPAALARRFRTPLKQVAHASRLPPEQPSDDRLVPALTARITARSLSARTTVGSSWASTSIESWSSRRSGRSTPASSGVT